jgi:hypothetical protein
MRSGRIGGWLLVGIWLPAIALCVVSHSPALADMPQPSIGLTKVDLPLQYLGKASGGDGSPAYVRVERAMAEKAIADAHQLGVKFFRIDMPGYAPSTYGARGDLDLWIKDPDQYWRAIDTMMADLRQSDIKIVPILMFNSVQFPAMTGERTADLLRNPNSRSWQMLAKYVSQFVNRYRGSGVILFYELTAELNLAADIDLLGYCGKTQKPDACAVMSNFTTADLVAFTGRLSTLIKSLDPSALVESGFSVPRPAAEHLRQHPASVGGKVDWTQDSIDELTTNLAVIHKNMDIISVHLYPGQERGRFGSPMPVDLLGVIKKAADTLGKPLFIGEFGDEDIRTAGPGSFVDRTLDEIANLRVPYSTLWVWEFYQRKPYLTYDNSATLPNLEPGYTDRVLAHLIQTNEKFRVFPPAPDTTPPQVVITWPLDCRPYTGDVPAQAVASAASGRVERVEFWLDDKMVDRAVAPPYKTILPLEGLSGDSHRLVAKAYDTSGNVGEYRTVLRVADTTGGRECSVR